MTMTARDSRPKVIADGIGISEREQLLEAYLKGTFYYQFLCRNGRRSRVCKCDSGEELMWLAQQIQGGANVDIQYVSE